MGANSVGAMVIPTRSSLLVYYSAKFFLDYSPTQNKQNAARSFRPELEPIFSHPTLALSQYLGEKNLLPAV